VQVELPRIGPDTNAQVALLKVPTPVLANVTVPVGSVGLVDGSLTVVVQVEIVPAGTVPGAQVTEVVVRWELDGLVALTPKLAELGVWLDELPLPSPNCHTSWYGGVPPVRLAVKLMLPPARRLGGFQVKSPDNAAEVMLVEIA
jgi:hypothetical protein